MLKKLIPKTIRGKIMAITGAVTFLITVVTVTVCFVVFQSFLMKNQIQSAQFSLSVVSGNIYTDLTNIVYFTKWCCSNREVVRYLEAFEDKEKLPVASRDNESLRPLALSTYNRVKEEHHNTTRSGVCLPRVIISTLNRKNFIQIYSSGDTNTSAMADTAAAVPYFTPLLEAPDLMWIGVVNDPFRKVKPEQILPLVRPVYDEYNSRIIGWVHICVSSRLFTDYLSSYPLPQDSELYVTVGGKTYRVDGKTLTENTPDIREESVLSGYSLDPQTEARSVVLGDGRQRTLVRRSLGFDDFSVFQILSAQQYNDQKKVYYLLIAGICAVILSLGAFMALQLNRVIGKPVNKLRGKIDDISRGDFSKDPSIEWSHELGEIGRGINHLSENIVTLMDKRVEDEKQRKDLEYQILLSQINPHFLYNTLNSIKWMATIQHAPGIAEMTTALARLLKNISKASTATVTLKEELDLVGDYFLIQKYRYGGSVSIEYQIQSEDLLDCQIHRFTLQPFVENALFHGIEPKGQAGKIVVAVTAEASRESHTAVTAEASRESHTAVTAEASRAAVAASAEGAQDLVITVTDNGVGMSQETIRRVLTDGQADSHDFFKQVGISNVNRRIKYDFGPDYGISISSEINVYTTMTIRIPRIRETEQKGEPT